MRTLPLSLAAAVPPAPAPAVENPCPAWSLNMIVWNSGAATHFSLELDSAGKLALRQQALPCEECKPVSRSFETTLTTDEAESLRGAVERGIRYVDLEAGRRDCDESAAEDEERPGFASIHLQVGDFGVALDLRNIERMKDASADFRAIVRAVNSHLPPEFEPL